MQRVEGVGTVFRFGLDGRSLIAGSLIERVRVRGLKGDSVFLGRCRGDDRLVGQEPFDGGTLRSRCRGLVG